MSPDSHWSGNQVLQAGTTDCKGPALITAGEVLHAAWTQDRYLYHAFWTDGKWTEPKAIGIGGLASLASTPDGRVHCLFSAEILGNAEIYLATWDGATWSPPEVVSHTTGLSIYPALAVGPEGRLHAAWADTTPGYPTIYYGRPAGAGWTSMPIPDGRGNRPAIAVGPGGEVYVAWQSRLTDTKRFDVFCSIYDNGEWSLPEDVSDTAQRQSIHPRLATHSAGACHLTWQEDLGGGFAIRHADRRPNGWSQPVDVSQSAGGCSPAHIATNRQGTVQAVWAEGASLRHRVRPPNYDAAWWQIETASDACGSVSELATTVSPSGVLHVLWCGRTDADICHLNYIRREPIFKHTTFMPIIAR